ncbi:MAG: hypothetical protein IJ760_07280 [Bacteroidales bacterium]|nr:hypothetical protein [Bacteroidales bacterium]
MSIKYIVAFSLAAGASTVFSFLLEKPHRGGRVISFEKRMRLEWIGLFVFLLLVDFVDMLFGNPITWRGLFVDVSLVSIFVSVDLFFHWFKGLFGKRKGHVAE